MNSKTVYLFDEKNGAYIGTYEAQASPMEPEVKDANGNVIQEQAYIAPIYSTPIAPPKFGANEIPVFHRELNAWRIDLDFRGKVWFNKTTGEPVEISQIGQPDASLVPVLPDEHALRQARDAKIYDLRMACFSAITAGFTSKASGADLFYAYGITDQSNLHAATLASLSPSLPKKWTFPIWCKDASGEWAMIPHTADQIQKLNMDGIAHRAAYSAKMAQLSQAVSGADSVADVNKVTW